jgi:threonine synthase
MAQAKLIDRYESVVCLVTGSGLKDVAGATSAAPEPAVIEPGLEAVARAVGSAMAGRER